MIHLYCAHSIYLCKASFSDLLSDIVIIFDLSDFRHVTNDINPFFALLLTSCEEFTVICRWELHPEAIVSSTTVRIIIDPVHHTISQNRRLNSGFLHRHDSWGSWRIYVWIDVHELVVDSHKILFHSIEYGGGVQFSTVLLHLALPVISIRRSYIHSRNLHASINLLIFKLMATTRAETHCDHTMTIIALQFLERRIRIWFLVNRKEFALTHTTETNLLSTIGASETPVSPRKSGPFLRMTLLCNTSTANRHTSVLPISSSFVNTRIDHIKGHRFIGISRLVWIDKRVVIRNNRLAIERNVAFCRIKDRLCS